MTIKRLIAALMCAIMLLAACPAALADDAFLYLYALFSDTELEYALGEPTNIIKTEDDTYLFFYYNVDDDSVTMTGRNDGEVYMVWWENVGFAKGFNALYCVLSAYPSLQGMTESDVTLAAGLTFADENRNIWVADAEKAQQLKEMMEELMNSLQDAA